MDTSALLIDAYGRIQELVHEAIDGLDTAGLMYRPEPGANSIAWLVWHLSRVQDDHVSEIAGTDQVWADPGWAERTGIARGVTETGFGDNSDDVAAVVPESVEAITRPWRSAQWSISKASTSPSSNASSIAPMIRRYRSAYAWSA
jgi:hypothetical protein